MIYSVNKQVELKREEMKLQRDIKLSEDKLKWERLELDKFDRGLSSKFDTPQKPLEKIDTPISDYLNHKFEAPELQDSKILNHIPDVSKKFKESINSPVEDDLFIFSLNNLNSSSDDYLMNFVSVNVVHYAGLTILGCLITITSAFLVLYLNQLYTKYGDENIHKAPFFKHCIIFLNIL
uniref:Uncharacterized protein n=1 Tax=Phycomyces blakesleeanus TaxID=4837 RepID=A0A0K1HPI1_PHYBL|nr:hypothetical protein [Phycomyces blakesleeanus]AKT93732.1 hypothetical protein [Phycomyces blakesleeanus]